MIGCGGSPREGLSGMVTFDGEPVPFGEVQFIPASGPAGSAIIRDGRYNTADEDGQGVISGPHQIFVTGYEFEPIDTTDDETAEVDEVDEAAFPETLFVNFELTGDLTGGTFDIDVPADAKAVSAGIAAGNAADGNAP